MLTQKLKRSLPKLRVNTSGYRRFNPKKGVVEQTLSKHVAQTGIRMNYTIYLFEQ